MQTQAIDVQGKISVNGQIAASNFIIYLSEFGLSLSGGNFCRKSVKLYPFSRALAYQLTYCNLGNPIEYSMSGPFIGQYSEQIGVPSDGEFINIGIGRFDIAINHSRKSTFYTIKCTVNTELKNESGLLDKSDESIIYAEYELLRESMKQFYGWSDHTLHSFHASLDSL